MRRFHQRRIDQATRDALAETSLSALDFIQPIFLVEDRTAFYPIVGLDGTMHVGLDRLLSYLERFITLGINKVLLFGQVNHQKKSLNAEASWQESSIVCQAIRLIKDSFANLIVYSDICLCAYTSHGHCGIIGPDKIHLDNDPSAAALAKMALAHAQAGVDWVAPSAMIDGQVLAIKTLLAENGYQSSDQKNVNILSYSAKFSSSFYGPFRMAAGSSPSFGDRKTYQMDYRNPQEAISEIEADIEEGATAVMIKPALLYLDLVARAKNKFPDIILAAYHTSGEFMMLRAAAAAGVIDYRLALEETLTAIKRAGSDLILSYAAEDYLLARNTL